MLMRHCLTFMRCCLTFMVFISFPHSVIGHWSPTQHNYYTMARESATVAKDYNNHHSEVDDKEEDETSIPESSKKKRNKEAVKQWGSPENRHFAEFVDKGTINIYQKPSCMVIDKIQKKHFGGCSKRSFQEGCCGLVACIILRRN